MTFMRFWLASGWRRTAAVNATLGTVVCIILGSILARSITLSGSVERSLVFYQGSCTSSGRLNLVLHLVINIVSTAILASSNYFMQILSSPSREEIDKAHERSRALEIGVPSLRNIVYISPVKVVLWVLFALSSIPLHVVFNSAVFETDYQGAQFFMAMATEDFMGGHDNHALLGASLVHPGATVVDGVVPGAAVRGSWGLKVDISQFLDRSSTIAGKLSNLSASAPSWTRLDAAECRAQYGTCTARRDLGDVVVVLDPHFENDDGAGALQRSDNKPPAGFIVNEFFNLTEAGVPWNPRNYSTSEIRAYWNEFGPVDQPNPLWFSAPCSIQRSTALSGGGCSHACSSSLGLNDLWHWPERDDERRRTTSTSWEIPLAQYRALPGLEGDDALHSGDPWEYPGTSTIEERPRFNTTNIGSDPFLRVTHCYAQPIQPICKVALSNTILLAVTVAVASKVILAVFTCALVRGDPLVTPGDAMASFLANPDLTTKGRAAIRRPPRTGNAEEHKRIWTGASDRVGNSCARKTKGKGWRIGKRAPRIGAGIPLSAWIRTYALISIVLLVTGVLLGIAHHDTPISEDTSAFSHSTEAFNPGAGSHTSEAPTAIVGQAVFKDLSFLGKIILANTPQLVLSLCYFSYNALFTRACTETEWNSYAAGTTYKPLRVSHPVGEQISTYRLQLPYRYSVPLIIVSIVLHWLVSNTIFVTIIEGDYLQDITAIILPGISDEKVSVALGFSSRAILVVLVLGLLVTVVPLVLFCLRRLKAKNMVICGNNSFIISAACHASPLFIGKGATTTTTEKEKPPAPPPPCIRLDLELGGGDIGTGIVADIEMQHAHLISDVGVSSFVSSSFSRSPSIGGFHGNGNGNGNGSGRGSISTGTGSEAGDEGEAAADDSERELLAPGSSSQTEEALTMTEVEEALLQVSRSRVRWGVVSMPPDWYDGIHHNGENETLEHLTFGTKEQNVEEPRGGHLYV